MSPAVILVVIVTLSAALCYQVAKKRKANVALWVVLASVFGPLAIPFVFFAKPKPLKR